jgi:hypothetical protein
MIANAFLFIVPPSSGLFFEQKKLPTNSLHRQRTLWQLQSSFIDICRFDEVKSGLLWIYCTTKLTL